MSTMVTLTVGIAITLLITFLGDVFALIYTALIVKTPLFDRFLMLRTGTPLAAEKTLKLRSLKKRKKLVIANVFFFKPFIAASGLFVTQSFMNFEQPSAFRVLFDLAVLLLISDASFYWLHRWMHSNKVLFKKIHVHHHRATRPLPLDYMYEHPLEIMIENLGTFVGIMILGHVSIVTLWLFGIIRVIHAVHTHSGVEFKGLPHFFVSGSDPHDLHHFRLDGNYAFMFKIFDRTFGTRLKAPVASESQKAS